MLQVTSHLASSKRPMERKKVAPPVPPPAPPPYFLQTNNSGTKNQSTSSNKYNDFSHPSKRPESARSKRPHKQRGENWDVGSLSELRGYAALSRDETPGPTVDWKHLTRSNDQDRELEIASSESETSSDKRRSISSWVSTEKARQRDTMHIVSAWYN